MKKAFIFLIISHLYFLSYSQPDFIQGKWQTYFALANSVIEFDSTQNVSYEFQGDLMRWQLFGKYNSEGDSVFIHLFPLVQLLPAPGAESDTLLVFLIDQKTNKPLINNPVEVFYQKNIQKRLRSDSSGKVLIPDYYNVDSLDFFWSGLSFDYGRHYRVSFSSIKSNRMICRINYHGWQLYRSKSLPDKLKFYIKSEETLYKIGNKGAISKYYKGRRQDKLSALTNSGLLNYEMLDFGDTVYLQHYRLYNWITIDTFATTGEDEYLVLNNYQLPVHSGVNKYRILIKGEFRIFRHFELESSFDKVTIEKIDLSEAIHFSDITWYEMVNAKGQIVSSGQSKIVDCKKLPKGRYYLHYDNGLFKKLKKK